MNISKYKEWILCRVNQGWNFFQRNEHRITNFEKQNCLFVSKTFKIVVFSWKNRRFNRKKAHFCQKKAQKSTFQKITGKKSHQCEKKHKKAHVLFKSTLYDPCIDGFCQSHMCLQQTFFWLFAKSVNVTAIPQHFYKIKMKFGSLCHKRSLQTYYFLDKCVDYFQKLENRRWLKGRTAE